jgi:hypothetical protein
MHVIARFKLKPSDTQWQRGEAALSNDVWPTVLLMSRCVDRLTGREIVRTSVCVSSFISTFHPLF